MECGIRQWQRKIIKSITALQFCKSEHPAAQHGFSWCHQSSHNLPLCSASYWNEAVTNPARRGENDHHRRTAPRTDTNQRCRCVAHDMAKGIQISRVTSANMTQPLDQDFGSQLQTALQWHHRPPIFMVPTRQQCQGRATSGKRIYCKWCSFFSENFHKF
jgi:hypothetical protein